MQKANLNSDAKIILDCIRSLFQALRLTSTSMEKDCGLSAAQLFVLENLKGKGPLSLNELASLTLTHQSSVSVVVQKLFSKGLVVRTANRKDLRSSVVRLSSKGQAFVKNRASSFHDRLLHGIRSLPEKNRRAFARTFQEILILSGFLNSAPPLFFEEIKSRKKK
jgi:DNA-binding MarR family transcriptional regulator